MSKNEQSVKKLVLNVDKWICGMPDEAGKIKGVTRGIGETMLVNEQGYMCCLGQFANQCGFKKRDLSGYYNPSDLKSGRPNYTDKQVFFVDEFSDKENFFIDINDDKNGVLTVPEKIKAIKKLLSKMNIKLKVKQRKR